MFILLFLDFVFLSCLFQKIYRIHGLEDEKEKANDVYMYSERLSFMAERMTWAKEVMN